MNMSEDVFSQIISQYSSTSTTHSTEISEPTVEPYQMNRDYKKEWTYWEAIREIIQNSMDTNTRIDVYSPEADTLVIHDNGDGFSIKEFVLGGGVKASAPEAKIYNKYCDPSTATRGEHGEGMKISFLIFSKEPQLYQFYLYTRFYRATANLILSKTFKENVMNIRFEPTTYHQGTTFILKSTPSITSSLIDHSLNRFIYPQLYVNNNQVTIEHVRVKDKHFPIGSIIYPHPYSDDQYRKPLYCLGIYVNTDNEIIFPYDLYCIKLDSARNAAFPDQLKDQLSRIYTSLDFNDPKFSLKVAETFVRSLYYTKAPFIERIINVSNTDTNALSIYRTAWDTVFGKHCFIGTNIHMTALAEEQHYVEKDQHGNIISTRPYRVIKDIPDVLRAIFTQSKVPRDVDIIKQETITVYHEEPLPTQLSDNLRNAISILCFLSNESPEFKFDPDAEMKKWRVFLFDYKTELQPPKTLWKKWDETSFGIKYTIFKEIQSTYEDFKNYPAILKKLNLLGIETSVFNNTSLLSLPKSSIPPLIASTIEQLENHIIPISKKYGYYKPLTGELGIRYDVLHSPAQTFTTVLHEYAHKIEGVDDIDESSPTGKLLHVIQYSYGIITDSILKYSDIISPLSSETILSICKTVPLPFASKLLFKLFPLFPPKAQPEPLITATPQTKLLLDTIFNSAPPKKEELSHRLRIIMFSLYLNNKIKLPLPKDIDCPSKPDDYTTIDIADRSMDVIRSCIKLSIAYHSYAMFRAHRNNTNDDMKIINKENLVPNPLKPMPRLRPKITDDIDEFTDDEILTILRHSNLNISILMSVKYGYESHISGDLLEIINQNIEVITKYVIETQTI